MTAGLPWIYSPSRFTFEVSMRRWPPSGMASRALAAKFIRTCSICSASTLTRPNPSPGRNVNSMSSPIRRGSVLAMPSMAGIEFDHPQGLRLFPAESQQLAGKFGGAPRGQQNLVNLRFQSAALRYRVHRQLGIAGNDSEKIIEVVSHASGQTPNRVHFLGLQQLRFQPQALGEIAAIGDKMSNLPVRVAHRADALFHVIQLAILLAVYQNAAIGVSGKNRLPHLLVCFRVLF